MVNMKAPKVPAPLRYSVDLNAIPVLIAACSNVRDKLVVSLLADTGLRLSELASLRIDDINLGKSSISVWGRELNRGRYALGHSLTRFLEIP
jgi:integrase